MPVFTTTTGTQIAKIELARLASRLMLMTFIAAKWSIDDYHQMVDRGLLNNRSGIPEYWVMNLPARELVVFRDLAEDAYQSETHLTNGTISSIAFPEIQVDIQRVSEKPRSNPPNPLKKGEQESKSPFLRGI